MPASNASISELNDPNVSKRFLDLEAATSASAKAAFSKQIDMAVKKDAVMLPTA